MRQPVFESYWVPGTFDHENKTHDDFVRGWYSAALCAMGEPPLTPPSGAGTRLRLLWLRSIHPAIAVRVEHAQSENRLVAVQLEGVGGNASGGVARRVERSLFSHEWEALQKALAETGLWDLPTSNGALGNDGAEWVIEIAEDGRYHVVDRWNGGEIEPVGRRLLALSQLNPDPIY